MNFFKLNHQFHHLQTPFGSAEFLTDGEAILLKLNEQGEGRKFCPYIGVINSNNPLFARKANTGINNSELSEGNGHLLTVAPTRAGKGTGQIIPNLITWKGSVFVIDVKGENYLRSAGFRATELNQNVIRFAPFEKDSQVWNPILTIRADPNNNDSTAEEEEDSRYLTNVEFRVIIYPKRSYPLFMAREIIPELITRLQEAKS